MCYGWWRTPFGGRRPSVEDDFWWKTTFVDRRPSVEDKIQWNTTLGGRWSLEVDNLRWKTTFRGRQPSVDPCMLPNPLCGFFLFNHEFSIHYFQRHKKSNLSNFNCKWYTKRIEMFGNHISKCPNINRKGHNSYYRVISLVVSPCLRPSWDPFTQFGPL